MGCRSFEMQYSVTASFNSLAISSEQARYGVSVLALHQIPRRIQAQYA
ncbi:hypothetical protein Tco_1001662, partial [Tanacetum coccineum]